MREKIAAVIFWLLLRFLYVTVLAYLRGRDFILCATGHHRDRTESSSMTKTECTMVRRCVVCHRKKVKTIRGAAMDELVAENVRRMQKMAEARKFFAFTPSSETPETPDP